MSIKTIVLASSVALTLVASAGAALADPEIQTENLEQYAVSAQGTLAPVSAAAVAREAQKLSRPSAFGTPGPYYVSERPFSDGNAHWGPAQNADQN